MIIYDIKGAFSPSLSYIKKSRLWVSKTHM